jgi:hypothetical protein
MGEINQDKIDRVFARLKPVKIKLAGQKYHLILDDQALKVFEFSGGNLEHLLIHSKGDPSLWELANLMRACMSHDNPDLTIEGVLKLLTLRNSAHAFEKLLECCRVTINEIGKRTKK